jgi:hypothetical protein
MSGSATVDDERRLRPGATQTENRFEFHVATELGEH